MSLNAYRRTMRDTATPKEAERQIFLRMNARLLPFRDEFDSANGADRLRILSGDLRQVLADNLKFWMLLRIDLVAATNKLPPELRANLISLSMFVERHTGAVIGGRADLGALIETNQSIINGLSGMTGALTTEAV